MWQTIRRLFYGVEFVLFYFYEVVQSNLAVAMDVLTPAHRMRPELIELDIRGLTDQQLLAYANAITMTPGTLSLEVSPDRDRLLIHAMYVDSTAELKQALEVDMKERICRVF